MSTVISKEFALANKLLIPINHMTIKTSGKTYLMINFHVFPTLNLLFSFNIGINESTSYIHVKIMHWIAINSKTPNSLTKPSTTPTR